MRYASNSSAAVYPVFGTSFRPITIGKSSSGIITATPTPTPTPTPADAVEQVSKDLVKSTDVIRSVIGSIGRWQMIICLWVALTRVPVSWHQLSIIFLAPPTTFRCTQYLNAIMDEEINGLTNLTTNTAEMQCIARHSTNSEELTQYKCQSWSYDRKIFAETIVTEWNLVCDQRQYSNIAQSVFMVGGLAGDLIFGMLSDRFGRKTPLVASLALQVLCGCAVALAPRYDVFLVCRLLAAVATSGVMNTGFVICMEITGGKWRQLIAILCSIPFSVGHSTLALVAYLTRDWRYFQVALSLPWIALVPVYYWLIPESPRWLLSVGRPNEAANILEIAAKTNNRWTNKSDLMKKLDSKGNVAEPHKGVSMLDLFGTPNMRRKTLCLCVNWFVSGFCFFGLAQFVGNIGGDIFVNVAVSGSLQVPGKLACIYFLGRFGRRNTLIGALLLAGGACLLIAAIPRDDTSWARIVLAWLGMVGMSISIPTVFLFSSELFPTVVRTNGIGTGSMCARLGSVLAPFVTSLDAVNSQLPALLFGLVPLLGATLCFLLPETMNTRLPQTLEEGESFGKKVRDKEKSEVRNRSTCIVETTHL